MSQVFTSVLPVELNSAIFSYLSVTKDVLPLRRVCRQLNDYILDFYPIRVDVELLPSHSNVDRADVMVRGCRFVPHGTTYARVISMLQARNILIKCLRFRPTTNSSDKKIFGLQPTTNNSDNNVYQFFNIVRRPNCSELEEIVLRSVNPLKKIQSLLTSPNVSNVRKHSYDIHKSLRDKTSTEAFLHHFQANTNIEDLTLRCFKCEVGFYKTLFRWIPQAENMRRVEINCCQRLHQPFISTVVLYLTRKLEENPRLIHACLSFMFNTCGDGAIQAAVMKERRFLPSAINDSKMTKQLTTVGLTMTITFETNRVTIDLTEFAESETGSEEEQWGLIRARNPTANRSPRIRPPNIG